MKNRNIIYYLSPATAKQICNVKYCDFCKKQIKSAKDNKGRVLVKDNHAIGVDLVK